MKEKKNSFEDIRQSINDYASQMNEVNSAIQSEKEKHSILKDQLTNYTDLDNESGYLKLKQEMRSIEDRLEFLQIKKRALIPTESALEADRVKFREEQIRITSTVHDKVLAKLIVLIDTIDSMKTNYQELFELMDLWSATYHQPTNITKGFLGDTTGILTAVDAFVRNIRTKVNK